MSEDSPDVHLYDWLHEYKAGAPVIGLWPDQPHGPNRMSQWERDKPPMQWRKACACRGGTHSGPRVAIKMRHENGAVVFDARYVRMACDICQTPWELEP